ncbi:putative methyltransferase [Escherichia coli]|uniref:Putative methyltransferase n=1 Tax=Escherichia coli TaxID=562 RepID=A0A2X3JJ50_ECOLX|nr:putative methyltransferase [Escherichia coli]
MKRCVNYWVTISAAHLLPLGIEQLPALKAFDTVFSNGRALPIAVRRWSISGSLKDQLVNEGELVLETLVIGMAMRTRWLVPGDRLRANGVMSISSLPRWR